MGNFREYGRLLISWAIVAVVVVLIAGLVSVASGAVDALGLADRWRAEREMRVTERLEAQAELLEQEQVGWLMLPGIIAQLVDTMTATLATAAGWGLSFVLAATRIVEWYASRSKRDEK